MGVTGLAKFLESSGVLRDINFETISTTSQARWGIDVSVLIHACLSRHLELANGLSEGPIRTFLLDLAGDILTLLRWMKSGHFVFDGHRFSAKLVNASRARVAADAAADLAQMSDEATSVAKDSARMRVVHSLAIAIAPYVRLLLIALRELTGVPIFVYVAMYEAEAHLTLMQARGVIDVIFTKDSDLLVHGAQNVIFTEALSGAAMRHLGA